MAKNLPAPENFRRHWEVQKRHSGALAPLLETLRATLKYQIFQAAGQNLVDWQS